MNIDALRIFCDVIFHQSFSLGATMNKVSQSAATQTIHRIEKELETQLVDRTKRPFVLTPEGKTYYDSFREILDIYDSVVSNIKSINNEVGGIIRVAAIYTVGLHDMGRCMREFMKTYPKAKIHLEFLHPQKVLQAVINGDVDLGVISYPTTTQDVNVIPLRSEMMGLVCPIDHPLAKHTSITLEQMHSVDYIAFDRDLTIRKEIDRHMQLHGVRVNIVMEFDNIETIKQAIESGLGISILPSPSVQTETTTGMLKIIPLVSPVLMRPIGIIHKHRKTFTPTTSRFIELLISSLNSNEDEGNHL